MHAKERRLHMVRTVTKDTCDVLVLNLSQGMQVCCLRTALLVKCCLCAALLSLGPTVLEVCFLADVEGRMWRCHYRIASSIEQDRTMLSALVDFHRKGQLAKAKVIVVELAFFCGQTV